MRKSDPDLRLHALHETSVKSAHLVENRLIPAVFRGDALRYSVEQLHRSFRGPHVEQPGIEAEHSHGVRIASPAHGRVI